jgi:HEAT repeat protein
VDGLIFDLKSPEAARRRDAAAILGDKKVVRAVPELLKLCNDPDVEVRRTTVRALGNIRDQRASISLAKMLSDTDKEIRRSSIAAILNIYLGQEDPESSTTVGKVGMFIDPLAGDRNDWVVVPGTPIAAEVLSGLAQRLQDDEKGIRQDAAKALGTLRGKAMLPKIGDSLKLEKDRNVLLALIRAIAKISESSSGQDLIPLIYHSDKAVHDEAIYTLGAMRIKAAVPDLTRVYLSNVDEVRRIFKIIPVSGPDDLRIKAFQALARIADAESKNLFVEALLHNDSSYRQAGAEGLARLADKEQVSRMIRLRIRENKEDARLAESYALFRMGAPDYLEDLIQGVENGNINAYAYLLEFRKTEIPLLYPYLESPVPKAREKVAEVVGLIADSSATKHLEALSADTNAEVVAAAVRAIRRINTRADQTAKAAKKGK